ncbi:HU family DNA-binding protein [Salinimicrobium xinjiangense]|uniref:hypothetical protein n=1 Tax=Salinimicrobium xinjiangense TaxID=438596 RepID=UPI0003FF02F6|nr:hypothetical protein [Salinimicrobium xinjiangense]
MEKIVNLVAEKAGITQAQAKTAVDTVAGFLKDRMPPALAGQMDNYLKDDSEGGGGGISDTTGKLGGII